MAAVLAPSPPKLNPPAPGAAAGWPNRPPAAGAAAGWPNKPPLPAAGDGAGGAAKPKREVGAAGDEVGGAPNEYGLGAAEVAGAGAPNGLEAG